MAQTSTTIPGDIELEDPNTTADRVGPDFYDAVVVGTGFAGMYALHALRNHGFATHAFEAGTDVGGTWYWNRYPGARCDVESIYYSYSFDPDLLQEWEWSERYAPQPEILRYAKHVADRLDLRRDITFETRVISAHFDPDSSSWHLRVGPDDREVGCRFLITAVGCLSAVRVPDWPGVGEFRGETYHTGDWPHEGVDFTGKRVAVIGTGSSGVQSIPLIAEQAAHLFVFQRTANYSVRAGNRPLEAQEQSEVKVHYPEYRAKGKYTPSGVYQERTPKWTKDAMPEEIHRELEHAWSLGGNEFLAAYADMRGNLTSNAYAADFVREKIAEIVKDPEVAERLTPRDHPLGAKRLCRDTNYYETYNRPNVELIDVRGNPIAAITPAGLRTADGQEYEVDAIVFATGYDAMTGALTRIDVQGLHGVTLAEKWANGPKTYLGITSAGFPNLFTLTGPGSPSIVVNCFSSIEQHVEWTVECLEFMRKNDYERIETDESLEEEWETEVYEASLKTLYPYANSWYLGSSIPGRRRVFMPYAGGLDAYRRRTDEVAAAGYAGFRLS
jgi:cyclohexanone monooxygenase